MESKMRRLVLFCMAWSFLYNLLGKIPYTCGSSPLLLNRSLEFSLTSRINQTGHWTTHLVVDKEFTTLPNNWKVNVKHSMTEYGGIQFFHLLGIFTVPPPRPTDYELFPGIGFYKFHKEGAAGFDVAASVCAKEGSHLAIINSEPESQVLQSIFERYPESGNWAYMGFHDRIKEGQFFTIFGQPLSSTGFSRWYQTGQPDNYKNEDCGSIHRNGGLNDINCDASIPFFCEYDLSWS